MGSALRDAVPAAFERVVDACLDEDVDFLVVAGDVFDLAGPDLRTRTAFARQMARLRETGIPAYVAGGNHDPGGSRLPDAAEGLRYFSSDEVERVEHERDGETVCVLYGRSHGSARETRNLAEGFERGPTDPNAIAVLHANVGGQADFEPYAPCAPDDLARAGMDYWALGHVHRPMDVLDRDSAHYPGCPQGLSPRDVGPRGCLLVELSDGRPSATFLETNAIRWTSTSVDVSDAEDLDSVRDSLSDASDAARVEATRPCILRVELVGRTPVRRELLQPGALEQLVDVVRAEQMTRDPWVWIDRVTDRTSSVLDLEELAASESFVGDVVDIARDWLSDPERARALVAEEAREAADRFRLPGLEPDADAVVAEALDIVLGRLLPEEDSE